MADPESTIDANFDLVGFINACKKAASFDLLKCSSGNMSWRLNEDYIALSVSRAWLSDLTVEQVAICKAEDGVCINGKTPTVEINFHLGILQQRDDVNVVLHFQSQYATAISCGDPSVYNFNIIPEIATYIGKIGIVEYLMPGSDKLADAVIEEMKTHNMAILRNHGLVTVGKDFDDAIQKAVFFELACSVLLIQSNPVPISESFVQLLREAGSV